MWQLSGICLILTCIIIYKLWETFGDTKIRVASIIGFVIIMSICVKYMSFCGDLEGFEVQEPDLDDDEAPVPATNKIKTIAELDAFGKQSPKLPKTDDKFQNTGEPPKPSRTINSSFSPQINIYGDYQADVRNSNSSVNVKGDSQTPYSRSSNSFVKYSYSSSSNNNSGGAGAGSGANSGINPRTIDDYLKPRGDIHGDDSFQSIADFLDQKNNSYKDDGSCNKPYAGENHGRFNTATLTTGTFIPGMAYMPPSNWSVPQYHPTHCRQVCNNTVLNTRALPIGIMDHGTPVFALEIGNDGTIAKTETDVNLTNVGSIMPKFTYREYVDCPEVATEQDNKRASNNNKSACENGTETPATTATTKKQ